MKTIKMDIYGIKRKKRSKKLERGQKIRTKIMHKSIIFSKIVSGTFRFVLKKAAKRIRQKNSPNFVQYFEVVEVVIYLVL